jgi:hypothetical protein
MSVVQITVGDALKFVSARVFKYMKNLFLIFGEQDPELRTSEMRLFITKAKKIMIQMLALLRWLNSPGKEIIC